MMKIFVFCGNESTIDEREETVVATIDALSRDNAIDQFKLLYYDVLSGRSFEDFPELGYAEISTPNNYKTWRIYI